ncbi:hypothetical protein BJ165DRAFT_1598721 [Panaeolus papilionaceus]|nr:hypothetical protein BJ165DRAFT_1598721 [Panaeolus papilionaceus]
MSLSMESQLINVHQLDAIFFGFIVGCAMFGKNKFRSYRYFVDYRKDSLKRRLFATFLVLLDASYFALSISLVRSFMGLGQERGVSSTALTRSSMMVRTFRAMGTIKYRRAISAAILCDHHLEVCQRRHKIRDSESATHQGDVIVHTDASSWLFTGHVVGPTRSRMTVCAGVSTALIDAFLAILMCISLNQGMSTMTMPRTRNVIRVLVRCFLTTGLSTSFAALSSALLFTLRPDTLLYFAVDIWIIQLYVNAILTLFNAKKTLHKRMEETIELDIPSRLLFGGDDGGADGESSNAQSENEKLAQIEIASNDLTQQVKRRAKPGSAVRDRALPCKVIVKPCKAVRNRERAVHVPCVRALCDDEDEIQRGNTKIWGGKRHLFFVK